MPLMRPKAVPTVAWPVGPTLTNGGQHDRCNCDVTFGGKRNVAPEGDWPDSCYRGFVSIYGGEPHDTSLRSLEGRLRRGGVYCHRRRECVRLGCRRRSQCENTEYSIRHADF